MERETGGARSARRQDSARSTDLVNSTKTTRLITHKSARRQDSARGSARRCAPRCCALRRGALVLVRFLRFAVREVWEIQRLRHGAITTQIPYRRLRLHGVALMVWRGMLSRIVLVDKAVAYKRPSRDTRKLAEYHQTAEMAVIRGIADMAVFPTGDKLHPRCEGPELRGRAPHTVTQAHSHTHARTHMHARTHAHARTRTHARTHIHT